MMFVPPCPVLAAIPVWGEYSLSGVMLTAVAVLMAGVAFLRLRNPGLVRFMRWAQALQLGLLAVASWQLLAALLGDNFALGYVAAHSEKNLAAGYKIAAFWAGQEGSLLLWALMLGVMSVLMAIRLRKSDDGFTAITLCVMTAATGFFTCVMLFSTHGNPFAPAMAGRAGGMGLNPALQNLAMVFHPPMLFLGYAGFTAPFAYMVAGLLAGTRCSPRSRGAVVTGRQHEVAKANGANVGVLAYASPKIYLAQSEFQWLDLARPWMVYSWITLTVGILLGAQWAYVELGWGGYWAWDPVENASLLPWLTGTALLHNAVLQTRRGIFKKWTAVQTAASFFLCILGTYLTRSGVIESVHAFEQSDIGYYFLAFLGALLAGSVTLIAVALVKGLLTEEHPLEALVSREGMFLIINVLLLVMTLTVTVGTLYPLISRPFGTPVTVSGPFYNNVVLPMGLVLAALMATGPVLGSGAGALERARGKLGGLLIAGAACAGLVLVLGYASLWALATAVAVGAVVAGFVMDVYASVRPRIVHSSLNGASAGMLSGHSERVAESENTGAPLSMAHGRGIGSGIWRAITVRHRHWGAQVAHLGFAAIVAGIAGSSLYGKSATIQLHPNDDASSKKSRSVGGYVLSLGGITQERRANHTAVVATVNLTGPRGEKFTLKPERRFYDQEPEQGATEVALRPGVFSDVYLTLAGSEADGSMVSITTLINPLVNWIWAGGVLLALGGLVCLIPSKQDAPAQLPPPLPVEPLKLNGHTKRERQRASLKRDELMTGRR